MNFSKIFSLALIVAGIGMGLRLQNIVKSVEASVSNHTVSQFNQYCSQNSTICNKVNFSRVFVGSISCPSQNQQISKVYVHAGDGQTLYELPDPGFQTVFSNNNNTVQVTADPHPHELSFIGVVCNNSSTPTPTPTATPDPLVCNDLCTDTSECQADLGPDYSCITRPNSTEGRCRLTANPNDNKCKTFVCNDRCQNDNQCATIGTGYTCYNPGQSEWGYCRLAANPDNEQCVMPEPTPTPTPNGDVLSQLSTLDPSCESNDVKASHRVKFNNVDQKGIGVLFRYNGAEQKALTGDDGWANVSFPYTGDGWVDSQPDGLQGAANYITKETDCDSGEVLGTTTEGQVLGAYAETGIVEDVIMSILGLAGVSMFTSGAVLHVKNRD